MKEQSSRQLIFIRSALREIRRLLGSVYPFLLGRRLTQSFNDKVLKLALRARGFENCCAPPTTGEREFVRQLSKLNPKLCIDVGANVGAYSELLIANTQSTIFAFEPLPEAFIQLESRARLWSNRLIAINSGLSNVEGEFELRFGNPSSELASFSRDVDEISYVGASNTNSVFAPLKRLDNFLDKFLDIADEIDLIKIDVEGLEWEVLSGAEATLEKMRPKFIQIEFNLHQLFVGRSILQFSKLLSGYKLMQLLPYRAGLVQRDPKDPLVNIFAYSNYVFVRNDVW